MDAQSARVSPDIVIAWFAARQHGLVAYRQLVDAGVGRGAIAHRVRAGRLISVHRGVYAVGYLHRSNTVRWMAAVLACGDGTLLSHTSALALWDLRPSSAARTHVTVRGRAGRKQREQIVVHRSTLLAPGETTTHRDIPVTSVARTLLDAAGGLQPYALSRAVERSEILELFDLRAIDRTLELHPRHPGAGRLSRAVETFRDDEITRSDLERIFLELCDAHHLPRPVVNRIVHEEEVDFLWPDRRLVAESDGRATHLTRASFERDRAKDAKLMIAGYRVVRFTYRQVLHDPRATAATLRALLG